ncbi:MAG: glycine cleavage system aminomethyltransferase GcvT [Actinobacteria bacterium]|nr:glycine cleavage system aminomethyltransferase GcvT [Actinomycetota bacterium]
MKHSPLHAQHLARNAKMADFGGWLMPIDYPDTGTLAEHTAVRERVGLFDVSHLGKASVRGKGAIDFLNVAFTNDLNRIEDGQAQYTMMCNQEGGVVDDLIVYRNSSDDFFLVPNASNTSDVVAGLEAFSHPGMDIRNLHEGFGVLAVQGPKSPEVLRAVGVDPDLDYMSFTRTTIAGAAVILCRTGYTGEHGYEILPTWEESTSVWNALVDAMKPFDGVVCGLGARDTLRTEMGYPLHGHELSPDITPVQASANWAVGWKKPLFAGSDVLRREREEGPRRRLVGLKCLGRGIPRAHMGVKNSEGEVVGEVTSGTFSPTVKNGIALALVSPPYVLGNRLSIDVRGKDCEVEIVKLPFVPSHVR